MVQANAGYKEVCVAENEGYVGQWCVVVALIARNHTLKQI